MLSGRQALAELDDALRDMRRGLSGLDTDYTAARSALARLQSERVGIYARLAQLRLLAIEQGDLVDALSDADRRVEEILAERSAALEHLGREAGTAEGKLHSAEARRAEQQNVVAAASEALDAAEAEAQARLAADEPYRAQLARTEQADFVADQAEEKAAAAREDRAEKGRPYETDALFSYLWAAGYGTAKYRAGPLTRWLDGKVARLCDYEPARRNYALLIEIPVRLEEHARAMRAAFDGEAEALRELEQAAAEAADVPGFRAQLDAAEEGLDDADASIDEIEAGIRALVEERGRFAAGEDRYYGHCLEVLSEALRRESVGLLTERATRTSDREDDELVGRLAEIERKQKDAEQDLDQFRRLHETQNRRLVELEEVRRRFKTQRFDDPLSEFANGALIALVLKQFLGGAVGYGDVWDVIRRQQRRRHVRANPNFGTLRFPRAPKAGPWRMPKGGGFHKGGGFRGGGFRSGGGFGRGGGFKTGGGF